MAFWNRLFGRTPGQHACPHRGVSFQITSLNIPTGSEADKISLTTTGGMIESFVKSTRGAWTEDDRAGFSARVREAGHRSISEEDIDRLLETERRRYRTEEERRVYSKTHPETGGCPNCGEGPTKYQVFRLGDRNVHKCTACGYKDY